jgi:hypothetical protein
MCRLTDIDERDRGPGYELVSLAVSALMSRGASGAGGRALRNAVAALLVARAGAAERPFSPNIRIAASMLFGLLGCPQVSTPHPIIFILLSLFSPSTTCPFPFRFEL